MSHNKDSLCWRSKGNTGPSRAFAFWQVQQNERPHHQSANGNATNGQSEEVIANGAENNFENTNNGGDKPYEYVSQTEDSGGSQEKEVHGGDNVADTSSYVENINDIAVAGRMFKPYANLNR